MLVDTTTRRLAGRAIDLELFGDLELKGKAQPATLWRCACPGMPDADTAVVGRGRQAIVLDRH